MYGETSSNELTVSTRLHTAALFLTKMIILPFLNMLKRVVDTTVDGLLPK